MVRIINPAIFQARSSTQDLGDNLVGRREAIKVSGLQARAKKKHHETNANGQVS
jgi:hypothetical protein